MAWPVIIHKSVLEWIIVWALPYSITDGVGQDVKIASVKQHPTWNPTTLQDDICILKLSQSVQYSR